MYEYKRLQLGVGKMKRIRQKKVREERKKIKLKKKLNQRQEMEGFKYSGEKESLLLLWWCKVTNV